MRGVMSMFTPMFSYWNDVMGCCGVPPVAMGENVVTGIGTRSPNLAVAVMPSDVRSCGFASVRVFVSVLSRR